MNARVDLNALEFAIFGGVHLLYDRVGFLVRGRNARQNAKAYFIGDKRLPWYVVGTSMVATSISSEHFIAQVGAGYSHGIVIAAFGWNAWIVYTLLIWIFLPYYMRTGLYTMPEFLERRYNSGLPLHLRRLLRDRVRRFASSPGSLYAGGIALESMFGLNICRGHRAARPADRRLHHLRRPEIGRLDRLHADRRAAGGRHPGADARADRRWAACCNWSHDLPQKFQVFHGPRHELFPVHRRLHRLSERRHLVQLHQPAHGAALPGGQGRMERAHGRGHRGLPAHHHAVLLRAAGHHRVQAVSRTWSVPTPPT